MVTLKLIAFSLTACLSITLGFILFPPSEAGELMSQYGYWNMLIAFSWFTILTINTYGKPIKSWFSDKKLWPIIGFALLATVFLYSREGGGFKITFDEHTISNVAKSMHYDRIAVTKESSYPGIFNAGRADKRPLLFSFLLASTHDITGYRIANAFYLNACLVFILFLLIYTILAKVYDARAGWLGVILASCTPLIAQNSSGGGLEIINLVGILSCMLLAILFGEKPACSKRLSTLIIAITVFSHARYESPVFIIPVAGTILYYWIRLKKIQITWTIVAAPLFFITIAWQQIYSNSSDSFKQYKYDSDGLFSLDYIRINLGHATNFFFSNNRFTASSPIISFIGLVSLITLVSLSITRSKQWEEKFKGTRVFQIFGAAIIGQFILILSFTYGQLDDPLVTRLGMPLILLSILCAAILLSHIKSTRPRLTPAIYTVTAICLIYALPMYSNHTYTKNNTILKTIKWAQDFHKALPYGNYLFISYLSQDMELHNIPNLSYKRAIDTTKQLKFHMEIGTYDEIYVIQAGEIIREDNEFKKVILPGNKLGPWYELETVDEISQAPFNFNRISRVVKINVDPIENEDEIKKQLMSEEPLLYRDIDKETYDNWRSTIP